MKRVFLILMTILVAVPLINGAENISDRKTPSLNKALATSDIWIDVNRMDAVFRNNGTWMYDNVAGGEGLFWPKGTLNSPIFAGGQWIGAMVDGEVRIAGIQHSASEYQAGEIISPDVAANRMDGQYKWYALYPGGVGDWSNWPVDQGAPVDENGNPLLIGDVTAFSVWNDLKDHDWVNTNKLNAELRQTVFAFNRADALGDMIFIKWQIINKSGGDWEDTYFSIWLDPDLGDAGDDLVGCDSTLGLGYVYNASNSDQTYGTAPPAAGIDFFQGPIIDEIGSTVALPDGTVLQDKAMLKMTSFVYYDNNDTPWGNPDTGGDVWNYMRGIWRDGLKITEGERGRDPDSPATNFMFSGDPETVEGWLDYDEEDRRFLMTTGPFDMSTWIDDNGNGAPDFGEPGVQEIVAVVIVASGADNLNSVTVLKEVDELAQLAYDLNFNLANAPAPPAVTVSELPNEVVLTWDESSEFITDEFAGARIVPYTSTDPIVAAAVGDTVVMDNVEKVIDDSTYNFYGYTVYQYADAAGGDPVILEHWDNGGEAAALPYASPHFAQVLVNKHRRVGEVGAALINGKPYYFGVVAEGYLEYGAPRILPSAASIETAIPNYTPGLTHSADFADSLGYAEHTQVDPGKAAADADVYIKVINPAELTGHDYKVFFDQQHYYRDLDGIWQKTNYADSVGKALGKILDVSGSTVTGAAIASSTIGTIDLIFTLDFVDATGEWGDGFKLTLPSEIEVLDTDISGAWGSYAGGGQNCVNFPDGLYDPGTNTIQWGDDARSGFGCIEGDVVFTVNVSPFEFPITVDYDVYDDGYGAAIVDAAGSVTITELGYEFNTVQHWNLTDVTAGDLALENITDEFMYSSIITGDPAPIVDGFQIMVIGSYAAPVDFFPAAHPLITGIDEDSLGSYDISSYGYELWAETARSIHAFGAGTEDLNILVKDYVVRYTGEYDTPDTTITGTDTLVVHDVKEGTGSIVTLYGARGYDIAIHPLNPNPGVSDPFLIRVPFELWNVDDNQQVNLLVYDRVGNPTITGTGDALVDFYPWNIFGRMYTDVLNTPYSETLVDIESATVDSLTWNWVWWENDWELGDTIHFNYANPIQLGNDEFSFSTSAAPSISADSLEVDLKKINVVPNPYYGYHSGELNIFQRWVQFTYLPPTATIRIYDLAGQLIRKLEKDDPTTAFLQWDLANAYDLPVASGVYIYVVDTDYGQKIGKMAVFTPNERMDTW